MKIKTAVVERFWKQVNVIEELDMCWIWTGVRINGYGIIKVGGKKVRTHRFSWVLHNGPIPKTENSWDNCVCHTCDNRACCNPVHLFLGTARDNMEDMNKKGRHAAKLTPAKVRRIRVSALTHRQQALKYGVHRKTIEKIRARERWAHIK